MSNKPQVKRIVVFGLGAAGANFIHNIVHSYPGLAYVGVDFDKVEPRNYEPGTQPYSKIDLNRPKVQAMQRILKAAKGVAMHGVNERIVDHRQVVRHAGHPAEALVIDAFDNPESRNLFLMLDRGLWNVIHIGFSPKLTGEVCWAESYSKMTTDSAGDGFDICEAAMARPFIQCLTSIASIVASDFIENGVKRSAYFDSRLKLFTF